MMNYYVNIQTIEKYVKRIPSVEYFIFCYIHQLSGTIYNPACQRIIYRDKTEAIYNYHLQDLFPVITRSIKHNLTG